MKEWLSVGKYAEKVGQTRQYIYILIKQGKVKTRSVKKPQIEVLFSDFKQAKQSGKLVDKKYQDLLSPEGRKIVNKALK